MDAKFPKGVFRVEQQNKPNYTSYGCWLQIGFITSGVQQIFAEMNNVCSCLVIQAGCVFLYLGVIKENPNFDLPLI